MQGLNCWEVNPKSENRNPNLQPQCKELTNPGPSNCWN